MTSRGSIWHPASAQGLAIAMQMEPSGLVGDISSTFRIFQPMSGRGALGDHVIYGAHGRAAGGGLVSCRDSESA